MKDDKSWESWLKGMHTSEQAMLREEARLRHTYESPNGLTYYGLDDLPKEEPRWIRCRVTRSVRPTFSLEDDLTTTDK